MPMICQQFRRSSSLFGDCSACGVWPTKSFHLMLLWPLSALWRVFLARARCLTDVNTITIFAFDLIYDSSRGLPLDFVLWFFKYIWDCPNRFMSDFNIETSKKSSRFSRRILWHRAKQPYRAGRNHLPLVVCCVGDHCRWNWQGSY